MEAIEFLDTTSWIFGAKTNTGVGGLVGQVTKCRWRGRVIFYVRENVRGVDSFNISSGERWGEKVGLSKPRKARWSLDLLAPDQHWEAIAKDVQEVDPHHRPVLRNSAFTTEWAEQRFSSCDS